MSGEVDPSAALPYRRVLMTGASGFVGGHMRRALRARLPADAVLFEARPLGAEEAGAATIPLDLTDRRSVVEAVAATRPDLVVHLGGQASVSSASHHCSHAWEVNACGSLWLAEAISAKGSDTTVLFASSAEVYGRAFLDGVASEATAPLPRSVYAQSKLAAEQMFASVLPAGSTLIVARPANHIGPGQGESFVVPSFAGQIATQEADDAPIVIEVGNLTARRDFLDVRDVIAAYLLLLSAPSTRNCQSVFNVSSGFSRSIRSLLDELRALTDHPSEVVVDPARLREAEIGVAEIDSSRLRDLTGWKPCYELRQSLMDVLTLERERARRSMEPL